MGKRTRKKLARSIVTIGLGIVIFGILLYTFRVFQKSRGQTRQSERGLLPTSVASQSTVVTPNQTKGTISLKQFSNQQAGYVFSYPANWQILDEPNVSGVEIQRINSQGVGFSISVRMVENPKKLSVFEFAKAQAYPRLDGVIDPPLKVTVGEKVGYKLAYLPPGLMIDIFLPHKNGGILNIFAGGEASSDKQKVDTYNRIVSNFLNSFKFLY